VLPEFRVYSLERENSYQSSYSENRKLIPSWKNAERGKYNVCSVRESTGGLLFVGKSYCKKGFLNS
jgi:hypothetical protein